MALQIDGFSVLKSIGDHAGVFGSVKAAAEKAAVDLVVKQMKGSAFGLENLKEIEAALGSEAFLLITDQLPERELPKILKKIDPHFPELKTAGQSELLTRLRGLSSGQIQPAGKSAPAAKRSNGSGEKRKSPPNETKPRALSSKAMGAKRK